MQANLRVIGCEGWRRAMHWPDTGLPFVPTSPAITSYEAALGYPGLCLFEATNLSVGRGTPLAFQAVGAPWLRAQETAGRFNALALPGVAARVENFLPTLGPHAGVRCAGVRWAVDDPKSFRPVAAALHLLALVLELHRHEAQWANYPTAANPTGADHFERLIGRRGIRAALEPGGAEVGPLVTGWTRAGDWAGRVQAYLLYD
jgi:uncharacterized protein YbbC (DUF1343 family)